MLKTIFWIFLFTRRYGFFVIPDSANAGLCRKYIPSSSLFVSFVCLVSISPQTMPISGGPGLAYPGYIFGLERLRQRSPFRVLDQLGYFFHPTFTNTVVARRKVLQQTGDTLGLFFEVPI